MKKKTYRKSNTTPFYNMLGMDDMSMLEMKPKRAYVRKKLTPRQMKLARSSRAKAGILNKAGKFKQTPNSRVSLKKDRERTAKPPGFRTSKKTGRIYSERRQNRSDQVGKNI